MWNKKKLVFVSSLDVNFAPNSQFFLKFDCKTCYSAFNGSRQFKNILNGLWQFFTGTVIDRSWDLGQRLYRQDIGSGEKLQEGTWFFTML